MVDLTRTDLYDGGNIPDADVETCLKVIRTLRNINLGPGLFDAETALIMSHAHARIHDLVKEAEHAAEGNPVTEPPARPGEGADGAEANRPGEDQRG